MLLTLAGVGVGALNAVLCSPQDKDVVLGCLIRFFTLLGRCTYWMENGRLNASLVFVYARCVRLQERGLTFSGLGADLLCLLGRANTVRGDDGLLRATSNCWFPRMPFLIAAGFFCLACQHSSLSALAVAFAGNAAYSGSQPSTSFAHWLMLCISRLGRTTWLFSQQTGFSSELSAAT